MEVVLSLKSVEHLSNQGIGLGADNRIVRLVDSSNCRRGYQSSSAPSQYIHSRVSEICEDYSALQMLLNFAYTCRIKRVDSLSRPWKLVIPAAKVSDRPT